MYETPKNNGMFITNLNWFSRRISGCHQRGINLHFHYEGQLLHPNFYSSHPKCSAEMLHCPAQLPSSHTVPKHSMALIFLPQGLPLKNAYSHRKPYYRNLYLGPIFTHRNFYLDLVGGFTEPEKNARSSNFVKLPQGSERRVI